MKKFSVPGADDLTLVVLTSEEVRVLDMCGVSSCSRCVCDSSNSDCYERRDALLGVPDKQSCFRLVIKLTGMHAEDIGGYHWEKKSDNPKTANA